MLLLVLFGSCKPTVPEDAFNLRIAVFGKLSPLGPTDENNFSDILKELVFEPLLDLDAGGGIRPSLAARVEPLSRRATRIWMRSDATFSDGTAVNADDIARSLERSALKVTKEKEGGLLIESNDAATPIEIWIAETGIHRATGGTELGTGAFAVVEQDPRHILLRRRTPSPRHASTVSLVAFDTPQEALARTLRGDADIMPLSNSRWIELLDGISRLRVSKLPGPFAYAIAFNAARLSAQERRELVKLLSTSKLRNLAFGDACLVRDGEQTETPRVQLPARKLEISAFTIFERFGLAVGRSLGDRGGAVRVEEPSAINQLESFDLLTVRPMVSPANLAMAQWHTGGNLANLTHYSNPRLDIALDTRDWASAERELAADPPMAVICNAVALNVMDARITHVSSTHFWQNVANWELSP